MRPESGYRFDCSRQPERIRALLRKEKDGTSPPNRFERLVEFPPFLACEEWRFFILTSLFALVSQS
jgi:hypothetical protein